MGQLKTLESDKASPRSKGFLAALERIGDALSSPFWLFVTLADVVIVSSWSGKTASMQVKDPASGDIIEVESLATAEYLQEMVSEAITNFADFTPVGLILVCMLGVAIAEYSGYTDSVVRTVISKVHSPVLLMFIVALAGVTGSIASDAVYVILIPLGAASFVAVGRNLTVGVMVAFAAPSAGFNSSLVLDITDVLLTGVPMCVAHFVDPEHVVSSLVDYFFTMTPLTVLALIITVVTELFTTCLLYTPSSPRDRCITIS